ncbi:resistance protein [Klebsiella pneumoniae]|uniref:Resistance protein n=1 Tax=Klebsiella pneumoniae TaxID=573 RepID=A0A377XGZ0_KLEPN|nr:resistance protein [Klebsiella pneumoniae]
MLGILSDKISRIRVITIGQVVSLVGMAALLFAPLNALTFFAAIACVAFNFGGTITVFPSLVSEFFGLNNLGEKLWRDLSGLRYRQHLRLSHRFAVRRFLRDLLR